MRPNSLGQERKLKNCLGKVTEINQQLSYVQKYQKLCISNSKLIARTEGGKTRKFLATGQQIPPIGRPLICNLHAQERFYF